MEKKIQRLFNAIKNNRFNWEKYATRQMWHNMNIQTQCLFCSYGLIGFETFVYNERGSHIATIKHDWEMDVTERTY